MANEINPSNPADLHTGENTNQQTTNEHKMRESAAHLFYIVVVLLIMFSVPLAILSFPPDSWIYRRALFVNFSLSFSLLFALFFLYCLLMVFSGRLRAWAFPNSRSLPPKLLNSTFNGLTRFETLSWTFFIAGVTAANTSAFDKSNEYWSHLNVAAPDMARAAVIAMIVLFFGQILKSYQKIVEKTEDAAKESKLAAEGASQAANDAREVANVIEEVLIPKTEQLVDRGIEIANSVLSTVMTEVDSVRIRNKLEELYNSNNFELFHDLTEELNEYVSRIRQEIYVPNEDNSIFEAIAFTALYKSYLNTERLIFLKDMAPGKSSCQFVTRFVHYAIAVATVVETFHQQDKDRYRFYTILNRRPDQFFNIDNNRTDNEWANKFLQSCLEHENKGIFYKRYFLVNDTRRGGEPTPDHRKEVEAPNWNDVYPTLDYPILCDENGLPILWQDNSDNPLIFQTIQEYVKAHSKELGISAPAYIIHKNQQDGKNFKEFNHMGLSWKSINEILPLYHNQKETPPGFLCFDGIEKYDLFFDNHFPRDFFAVWDSEDNDGKGDWCLFIGTEGNYGTPSAVKLVFLSRQRVHNPYFNWEKVKEKLTMVFLEKEKTELEKHGISKLNMNWNEEKYKN